MMSWFTAIFFTAFAYHTKKKFFLLIAAVGWIATSMSLGEIAIYGFDAMGNVAPYYINVGDPHTAGMLGVYYWWWGIGMVLMLLTGGYMISGKQVGDEV